MITEGIIKRQEAKSKAGVVNQILFEHRLSIARQCQAWCDEKGIAASTFNVLTAAVSLGLLEVGPVKEYPEIHPMPVLYENFPMEIKNTAEATAAQ